jgi:predicted TIM-barrel fold metal-dependent hydrolase
VKVHGEWSGTPTASKAMTDTFELLARFGRPVKIHNAGAGWDEALATIARRHPRLPIVIAHAGLGTPSVEGARLAASNDNIYLELSSSFAHLPTVREAVSIAGPARLLWGSDAPLLEPAFVLGTYLDAGLPPVAIDQIFWRNAMELFGW